MIAIHLNGKHIITDFFISRTPLHELALSIKLLRLGSVGQFLSKVPDFFITCWLSGTVFTGLLFYILFSKKIPFVSFIKKRIGFLICLVLVYSNMMLFCKFKVFAYLKFLSKLSTNLHRKTRDRKKEKAYA